MAAKSVQIDIQALDAEFKHAEKHRAEYQAQAKSSELGSGQEATGIDVGGLETTFCGAWPKVRPILMQGIRLMAWVPSMAGPAAMARSAIHAIDKVIVPAICGTP